MAAKKVLLVLTSNDKLGEGGDQTGWYLPELAHPFEVFSKAGFAMTLASPKGGVAPIDLGSVDASKEDIVSVEFWNNPDKKKLTEETVPLAEVKAEDFDALFVVGGFGTMWDLPDNEDLQKLIRDIYEKNGVISAVCHGPCALVNVTLSDGSALVKDKQVAAFTNEEEDAVQRRSIVPWTCEDKMMERGAIYTKRGVFQDHSIVDGRLITGQNPPSANSTAASVVKALSAA
ncbi:Glutathione-independent glyoxalase HSP31 (Glyoxalase 3 homolog 1) (Heat shock protein 31) [Durusdinium trenchii]|uniref:Glutathione-independent glyoxalase HSP31 (Glyoxalase 3 homolog 1) (Heat shock protein 31) n=1 Tax=Durusdinium trenchii TaxID=1381693 RepID=A0ABP0RE79_9DINO